MSPAPNLTPEDAAAYQALVTDPRAVPFNRTEIIATLAMLGERLMRDAKALPQPARMGLDFQGQRCIATALDMLNT